MSCLIVYCLVVCFCVIYCIIRCYIILTHQITSNCIDCIVFFFYIVFVCKESYHNTLFLRKPMFHSCVQQPFTERHWLIAPQVKTIDYVLTGTLKNSCFFLSFCFHFRHHPIHLSPSLPLSFFSSFLSVIPSFLCFLFHPHIQYICCINILYIQHHFYHHRPLSWTFRKGHPLWFFPSFSIVSVFVCVHLLQEHCTWSHDQEPKVQRSDK